MNEKENKKMDELSQKLEAIDQQEAQTHPMTGTRRWFFRTLTLGVSGVVFGKAVNATAATYCKTGDLGCTNNVCKAVENSCTGVNICTENICEKKNTCEEANICVCNTCKENDTCISMDSCVEDNICEIQNVCQGSMDTCGSNTCGSTDTCSNNKCTENKCKWSNKCYDEDICEQTNSCRNNICVEENTCNAVNI